MTKRPTGVINATEAYAKAEVLARLGVSQAFWDKMLDEGLPFTPVGHSRWVLGQDLLDYLRRHAERKSRPSRSLPDGDGSNGKTTKVLD